MEAKEMERKNWDIISSNRLISSLFVGRLDLAVFVLAAGAVVAIPGGGGRGATVAADDEGVGALHGVFDLAGPSWRNRLGSRSVWKEEEEEDHLWRNQTRSRVSHGSGGVDNGTYTIQASLCFIHCFQLLSLNGNGSRYVSR